MKWQRLTAGEYSSLDGNWRIEYGEMSREWYVIATDDQYRHGANTFSSLRDAKRWVEEYSGEIPVQTPQVPPYKNPHFLAMAASFATVLNRSNNENKTH